MRLVRRAKADGVLRADFSPHDLPLIMMATAGVTRSGSPALGVAADRLVGYLLQSFAAVGSDAVPRLPAVRALYEALEA
ncbi:hypothetical protein GCM10009539_78580 [Cryptosporangium japonicum]|uniref:TetR family transcriptional regulator n=1 Tax=Cryptosporangium japonicum TaxID=80872 RepID=A0ABN0V757_9ACTN